jgi:hypothetical protein
MAGPYVCDICQSEEAAFLVGNLADASQQFLGPGCFARAGLDFAKSVLPPEEIAEQLGPMFVSPGPAPAEEGRPRKGGRKSKPAEAESEPPAEPDPGLAEATTAANDT